MVLKDDMILIISFFRDRAVLLHTDRASVLFVLELQISNETADNFLGKLRVTPSRYISIR